MAMLQTLFGCFLKPVANFDQNWKRHELNPQRKRKQSENEDQLQLFLLITVSIRTNPEAAFETLSFLADAKTVWSEVETW